MKRWLLLVTIFSACVGAVATQISRGQIPGSPPNPGDIGPGAGGAVLRTPGMEPTPEFARGVPSNPADLTSPRERIAQLPSNQVDINKEFEITPQQGPWAILVMSYAGPEAPQMAREFVIEMRNTFKLNAFVYNYGAEEKRKEYERVQKVRRDQIEALQKADLHGKYVPSPVRAMKIDEHTGVLIAGNYRTRDEALGAVKLLRKLKLEQIDKDFTKHVKLDVIVAINEQKDSQAKSGVRVGAAEIVAQNPFNRAFPVRNPAMSEEQSAAAEPIDMELLHALNAQEPLSLLQVRKAFTLVIKQFNTQQVMVRNKKEEEKFLDNFRKGNYLPGSTEKEKKYTDQASVHAHNLAEAFRKSGLAETYVLHTKYCSFVTVGSFNSIEDPLMKQWQDILESRFQMNAYQPIGLLPRPAPMAVPH